MNTLLMFAVISLVLIYAIARKYKEKHHGSDNSKKKPDAEITDELVEMEDIFFEKIRNGATEIRFLDIYTQYDLMILKSLFQSEGIPYRTEFECLAKVKSGPHIGGQNNIYLYILKEDIDDAIELVKNYLQSKQLDDNNEKENLNRIRNAVEFLIFAWVAPSPQYYKGVEILAQNENP
jgi:hypothetical protein